MQVRIPEQQKKPGVSYAVTDDGIELPVVDVTHAAFQVRMSEAEISEVIDETLRDMRASASLPAEALQAMFECSVLLRGVRESANTFTTGMMTYLQRLGPENLGAGYASDVDRRFAASMMPLSFRFRLRDVATLLADALQPALAEPGGRPVELVNVAGGPAMDSLNALLLLHKRQPGVLTGRSVRIRVLDLDAIGPRFGGRALAALLAPDGALRRLDVSLVHVPYDWSHAEELSRLLGDPAGDAIAAGSTEGGLFDYGSDETIVANLKALHAATSQDFVMVGSVVRDLETLDPRLRMTAALKNRPATRYLGLRAFRDLASAAGWTVVRSLDSTAHHVVLLRKG